MSIYFFDNPSTALPVNELEPHYMYNGDETGVHIIQDSHEIIPAEGMKQAP
jgi:hypothetical protein